jgi:hypothetical protein
MSVIDLDSIVAISQLRGKHYIRFRSHAVQRWAAGQVPVGREYYTLTTVLWRKAGIKERPNGNERAAPGATYYFSEEADALEAAKTFLAALETKGVKLR